MSHPLQLVLILDALAPVKAEEILHLIPGGGERRIIRLSEKLRRTPLSMSPPLDWWHLGRAVAEMASTAKEASAAGPQGVELYVAGRAPLPLFVALGQALNFSPSPSRTVLNTRRGGPWEAYPMEDANAARETTSFEVEGLDRIHPSNARVAVFVSTVGTPAPVDAIERLFSRRAEQLADVVSVRTSRPADVNPEQMPAIAEELRRTFSRIPGQFPKSCKFALFLAGPTQLAFAAGLALSPHVFGRDVWIANYAAPDYEYTFTLPLRSEGLPLLPDSDGDRLARRDVMDAVLEGIEELRGTLEPDDFPGWIPGAAQRRRWIQYLRDLTIAREPEGDAFRLSILARRLSLGRGLLQALRGRDRDMQRGFGQLLLLHEIHHDEQEIRSSNHQDVGRAGVVLEEADFVADAFALAVLIRWELRRGGPKAMERAHEIAPRWVGWSISGIEAFDRLEQGESIERLYERRLRRYLIWYLQRERARTVRPRERAMEDLERLFSGRLSVELAPLAGHLDERFEKLVTGPTSGTELFATLDGHLIREAQRPGFDPGGLVKAVRAYDAKPIEQAMMYVVDEHRRVLVPWAIEE